MILPYALRLVCLCLASFFLVHLALALAVRSLAPAALKLQSRPRALFPRGPEPNMTTTPLPGGWPCA